MSGSIGGIDPEAFDFLGRLDIVYIRNEMNSEFLCAITRADLADVSVVRTNTTW
jgi:hypothetical protein